MLHISRLLHFVFFQKRAKIQACHFSSFFFGKTESDSDSLEPDVKFHSVSLGAKNKIKFFLCHVPGPSVLFKMVLKSWAWLSCWSITCGLSADRSFLLYSSETALCCCYLQPHTLPSFCLYLYVILEHASCVGTVLPDWQGEKKQMNEGVRTDSCPLLEQKAHTPSILSSL